MDVRHSLETQFRAGLTMLRECITLCPDEAWRAGEHPRSFWRIAYHALYFTHLYLMPTEHDFVPWEKDVWHARVLWDDDEEGVPPVETTYSQADLIGYCEWLESMLPEFLARVDLESESTGFSWYKKPNKLDHLILNVRHLGVHVGQLQERLYAVGAEPNWSSLG